MAHLHQDSQKLIGRIRRIQGQLEAVVRAIDSDQDCGKVLQTLAASRGALAGLFVELLDQHLDRHILRADSLAEVRRETSGVRKLIRSYLK
jgi:DNA-binding FrmR family transcriptional regulator